MNPAGPRKGFVPKAKALNCPNCGSQIELRALGAAASVICRYCSSTIDASHPQLRVIAQWQAAMTVEPVIPLGSRGKLQGVLWEAIGFQQRGITVDGTNYFWREYVLWNPYHGFRYLSEYNNHWNFVTPLQTLPQNTTANAMPGVRLGNTGYRHFQTARAYTWFVIGEFPWMVQVGEAVDAADYVAPPKMLSSETSDNEVTWSESEYLPGAAIWEAFGLKTPCPPPAGVFANQPSPYAGRVAGMWKFYGLVCAGLLAMMLFFAITARRQQALDQKFVVQGGRAAGERSFVTEVFPLEGKEDNVAVRINADVANRWVFLSMALINEETGQAYDFGQEVSYYTGRDSDGDWSEGSRSEEVLLPGIPGGRYYLRVEPETDAAQAGPIPVRIRVVRGLPYNLRYFLGMLLVLIPPVWVSIRSAAFEAKRWGESDYAGGSSGSEDGE
jgi:hypothetical protein